MHGETELRLGHRKLGRALQKIGNIVDGILYAPFVYIKGVGEKTAEKVASVQRPQARMGFFTREQPTNEARKNIGRYTSI